MSNDEHGIIQEVHHGMSCYERNMLAGDVSSLLHDLVLRWLVQQTRSQ